MMSKHAFILQFYYKISNTYNCNTILPQKIDYQESYFSKA